MKTLKLSTITILFVCFLLFTGCGPAPVTEMPTSEAIPAAETPVPTQEPAPTATPLPLPCTIAFDSDRDGNREIYVMDPDGSNQVNLTNDPDDDFNPAWSPDGSQIAFVSTRPNEVSSKQAIYIMDANGGNVFQLTTNFYSDWPDWSHDGKQITYTGDEDIYVIKADGSGQPVNLTNSPETDAQPAWSPDGSKIAWLSGNGQNSNVFVMNADGSNILKLTDKGKVFSVLWTIDGEIFSDWDHPDGVCKNCVMGADGSNIRNTGGKGEVQRYLPFKTSDGDRVECISGNINAGNEEIYLVGEIYPDIFFNLTNNPGMDRNPDWPANCLSGFEGVILEESAAPGTEPADTKNELLLGYAGDDLSEWQQRKENFQRACDELDIRCVYGKIPELVEQNVNAIVLNSVHGRVLEKQQDIQKAIDKGMPVFLLDAELDMDGVYNITIDQHEWAKISLEWMFKEIGGKGQVAIFDVYPDYGHTGAINEILSMHPGITVVENRGGAGFDPGKVKPETADFVKMYPELKAVWTNANTEGAIQGVVDESGAPMEKWPVLVCEASSQGLYVWMSTRDTNPNFDCIAVGNPPGIAYDAVYAAYYLVTGSRIDESVLVGQYGNSLFVDIPIVTSDNLQEWLETNSSVDQMMTPEEIKEEWFLD